MPTQPTPISRPHLRLRSVEILPLVYGLIALNPGVPARLLCCNRPRSIHVFMECRCPFPNGLHLHALHTQAYRGLTVASLFQKFRWRSKAQCCFSFTHQSIHSLGAASPYMFIQICVYLWFVFQPSGRLPRNECIFLPLKLRKAVPGK